MKAFKRRRDNQIMGLELLSIAYGLSTFADSLRDRDVVIFSDNTGAEHATQRGAGVVFRNLCVCHGALSHDRCRQGFRPFVHCPLHLADARAAAVLRMGRACANS